MKLSGKAAKATSRGARKSATGARTASAKKARGAGESTGDCKSAETWTILPGALAPKGYTAVWVPNKTYDRVAAAFLKDHRSAAVKKRLKARQAGLSLDAHCEGTCDGGWCAPLLISDNGDSKVWVCECEYFV